MVIMKLLGHPIHPLFIHFPTALLPMDAALTLLYYSTGNASYYQAGAYCLWAGASIGLLSLLTGIIDLLAIPRSDKMAMALALYHGFVNGLLILIFAVIAYKAWQVFPTPLLAGTAGVAVKGFLVIALFSGNYMGGRLIYKHHVGINFKKRTDGNATA
jgi:uncharacterized membrane protein